MDSQQTMNLDTLSSWFDSQEFKALNEEMSFDDYLAQVYKNPKLARTSHQRLFDMIMSKGTSTFERYRKTYTHYNFFDDPEIPIFGLADSLERLVKFIRGAAGGYGTEKRILLFHGPVGSSKSTICRLIKKEMEKYSRTDDGAWYSYKWVNLPTGQDGIYTSPESECPMHEDPLKLIPIELRKKVLEELNRVYLESTSEEEKEQQYSLRVEGELNPRCKKFMTELLKRNNGNWGQVVKNHIRVIRKVYSEADRMGIATFQPKDEKNQDSTELTGDINYAQLPHFGSDSDPRAFNFDGEFCCGNRGVVEFIEVLKLAKEFLYDLLGASQEQQIKPKKFSQIHVDTIILSHTNNPEYERLRSDQTMEALRDRTVRIDVPYLLRWSEELAILNHHYKNVKQHIAPHTLEIGALWAILTRLQDNKEVSLVEKAKLYDGRSLPGFTQDRVRELRDKFEEEGMKYGVSCRYVQDKTSNCLSSHYDYINPFMLLNELESGLTQSSLFSDKDEISKYKQCIDLAKKELGDILKTEVQEALVGDKDAIVRLCANYIDNLVAYIDGTKVKDKFTGEERKPDEKLMRSIEEKINISEVNATEFRRSIQTFIGGLATKGIEFKWDSEPRLEKALKAKLFEDCRDHIKLSALSSSGTSVVDPDIQKKIDGIKQRLIENYGYNEKSATDVLDFVGSIFARGDVVADD
jgi:serine protein kinase